MGLRLLLLQREGHERRCSDHIMVPLLKAQELTVALTALDALRSVLGDRLEQDAVLAAKEYAGLRLEVLDAEVRHEDVLSQLLLQLFLDFLAKAHVDLCVVRVELGEDDDLEAPYDALLRQLKRFRDSLDLVVAQVQLVEVVDGYVLLPLAILEQVFN